MNSIGIAMKTGAKVGAVFLEALQYDLRGECAFALPPKFHISEQPCPLNEAGFNLKNAVSSPESDSCERGVRGSQVWMAVSMSQGREHHVLVRAEASLEHHDPNQTSCGSSRAQFAGNETASAGEGRPQTETIRRASGGRRLEACKTWSSKVVH